MSFFISLHRIGFDTHQFEAENELDAIKYCLNHGLIISEEYPCELYPMGDGDEDLPEMEW